MRRAEAAIPELAIRTAKSEPVNAGVNVTVAKLLRFQFPIASLP